MKKVLIVLTAAVALVACKQKKQTVQDQSMVLSATDSAELKEFKDWKAKKDAAKTQASTVVYNNNTSATAPSEQTSTKKKGWSKAAKGAVIGAGTGAVAGAIINKRNRAAGAAIGAVIGGGAGYGIGRAQDKKDGRH